MMQAATLFSEQIAQIAHRLAQMDRGSRRGAGRIVADEAIRRPLTLVLRIGVPCLRWRREYGLAPTTTVKLYSLLFTLYTSPRR